MLDQIEQKTAELLKEKLAKPRKVDVREAHKALLVPAIDVLLYGGKFRKVAQGYRLDLSLYVVVTFQNLTSEQARRKGAYPMLQAIMGWLIGERLGLEIDRLAPKRLDNITTKEEAEEGKIVFQLEFETSCGVGRLSDEEAGDLLLIGLDYYLKPGDDEKDATDIVRIGP